MQVYYLYTGGNPCPPMQFLALGGSLHRKNVLPVRYGSFVHKKHFPPGLYIYSDLELLGPAKPRISAIHEQMTASPDRYRVLNHPRRTLTRYPLLRTLYERGFNDFNVHRADGDLNDVRFPVFLRRTDDHKGPRSGLLTDAEALRAMIGEISGAGEDPADWLVTEFCDTSDDERCFRKYSSFIFGDDILPRHVFFGKRWMLKHGVEEIPRAQLEEELRFIRENSFADQLREIFRIAGVEFGRIDFGVRDGRVQTWEINTNPMVLSFARPVGPRAQVHELFYKNLSASLDKLIAEPPCVRPGLAFLPDRLEVAVRVYHERRRQTAWGRFWHRRSELIKGWGRALLRRFTMAPEG